jgi:hypothetical protein
MGDPSPLLLRRWRGKGLLAWRRAAAFSDISSRGLALFERLRQVEGMF